MEYSFSELGERFAEAYQRVLDSVDNFMNGSYGLAFAGVSDFYSPGNNVGIRSEGGLENVFFSKSHKRRAGKNKNRGGHQHKPRKKIMVNVRGTVREVNLNASWDRKDGESATAYVARKLGISDHQARKIMKRNS